ncbi:hypothetical protein ICE98_01161 [Lactococcus lactis]|nr:hypothetical protein [Lactococcus lactis]
MLFIIITLIIIVLIIFLTILLLPGMPSSTKCPIKSIMRMKKIY